MSQAVPAHLLQALQAQYGPALSDEILRGFTQRRPVTFRLNPLKTTPEEADALLAEAGIVTEPVPWYPHARIAASVREDALQALSLYAEGKIYLQSLSAMIPPLLMPLRPGQSVLDMCAAPGGKSTQLAALSGGQISLTCCERDAMRAQRLQHNLTLQGVRRAVVMNTDARQLDPMFRFDAILLDAPCTGSGTLLTLPDLPPRRMDPAWVRKTVATQKALMRKAIQSLQPGGILVYSTCSILREENEEVVETALAAGAALVPVDPELTGQLPVLPVTLPGCLCIRPTGLYEGFFVAVLRK